VWVFGYGSLITDGWEVRHNCLGRHIADLAGYCRVFNKASVRNWGTKTAPGLTLNLSDVEYQITPLGRTARVLNDFGLGHHEISTMTIEPHRHDVDGRWWVKVSSPGNPTSIMEVGATTKLAIILRALGVDALAKRFETETATARRYEGLLIEQASSRNVCHAC